MAVTRNLNGPHEFLGLSTDDMPMVDIALNSLFLELDTGKVYYFDGSDWLEVGAGGGDGGDGYEEY